MRKNHAALTIGEGLDLAQRLENPQHAKLASCMCDECEDDRKVRGCENPHTCTTAAASRLGQILPKWIPKPGEDKGTAPETPDEETMLGGRFLPPSIITNLSQGLRAMTYRDDKPKVRTNLPVRKRAITAPIPESLVICIAGAVHTPQRRKPAAVAGLSFETEND
jgi:hypothetical protein